MRATSPFVGAAGQLLEQELEDREDLDVAVVVDHLFPIGREVEGVDQVDVVEVRRRGKLDARAARGESGVERRKDRLTTADDDDRRPGQV